MTFAKFEKKCKKNKQKIHLKTRKQRPDEKCVFGRIKGIL